MALHKKLIEDLRPIVLGPMYARPGEEGRAPRHTLPELEMSPDTAYQVIHDELMLAGNARLNLATFVTTWMEPQTDQLMAETFDKNMIDKDEYPRTAFAFALKDADNYTVFDVSERLREDGWLVPAYTFPENRQDLAALRVVVRNGFSRDLADLLVRDLQRHAQYLDQLDAPLPSSGRGQGFSH